jgi:hypothetical protein
MSMNEISAGRDAMKWFLMAALSGTTRPSKRNEAAFDRAVSSIVECARELFDSPEASQRPRNREEKAAKVRARSAVRFA